MYEIQRQPCTKCGGKKYYMAMMGTPSTPPDIMGLYLECSDCGNEFYVKIFDHDEFVCKIDEYRRLRRIAGEI